MKHCVNMFNIFLFSTEMKCYNTSNISYKYNKIYNIIKATEQK